MLTYIHTYIHTYTHTYKHTYIHTHIHTYIQTYDPEWNEDFTFSFTGETVTEKGVGDLVLGVKDWDATALLNYDHVGRYIHI